MNKWWMPLKKTNNNDPDIPPVTVYTDIEARHEAQLQRQDEEFAEYPARADEITEAIEEVDDKDYEEGLL